MMKPQGCLHNFLDITLQSFFFHFSVDLLDLDVLLKMKEEIARIEAMNH